MRYRIVDVFTKHPLEGNPLAVFPDNESLDDATMQNIARELNLSETVFVVPSGRAECVARLRIFTPNRELDFAGHPTIGTGFVLLDEKIAHGSSFLVEENVGPVKVRAEAGDKGRPMIWLTTPAIAEGPMFDRAVCAEVLGLEPDAVADAAPQLMTAGNPTIFIPLKTREAVDRAGLDRSGLNKLVAGRPISACVFVFAPVAEGAYSRMFAPELGIGEDPATGSSTGPLAAYMMRHGMVSGRDGTRFVSEQGTKMKRRSLLHVQIHGEMGIDGIEVGGYTTPLVEASMRF